MRAANLRVFTLALANRHKLNDIQVLPFWKPSHAVRQCFICVQSERMKQFLSALKRQKGARPSPTRPKIQPNSLFSLSVRLLPPLRSCRRCHRWLRRSQFSLCNHYFRGWIRRLTIFCFRRCRELCYLRHCRRHKSPFALSSEGQPLVSAVPIDAHQVSQMHLLCSEQIRKRIHDVPLNRPLQVPGSISLICSFLQQEVSAAGRYPEQKLPFRGLQHPLLYLPKLNLKYFFKLFPLQRVEHHHFVQPVHEFRRKLPSRGFHRCPFNLFVQSGNWLVGRLNEAHAAVHQFGNLAAAQVRRQGRSPSATDPRGGCRRESTSPYPASPVAIATGHPTPSQFRRKAKS